MNSKPALAADSSQPRGSAAAARVVVEPLEQRREGGVVRRPRRLHRRHLLPLHHPPLPAAPSCNSRAGAGLGADARRAWSRRRGRNGSSRLAPPPAYGRRPRAPSGSGRSPISAQLRVRGRGRRQAGASVTVRQWKITASPARAQTIRACGEKCALKSSPARPKSSWRGRRLDPGTTPVDARMGFSANANDETHATMSAESVEPSARGAWWTHREGLAPGSDRRGKCRCCTSSRRSCGSRCRSGQSRRSPARPSPGGVGVSGGPA